MALRDFVHVTDLAAAHLMSLAQLEGGGASRALNLGTGRGASVLEVVRAVERVSGRAVPREMAPRRPGDPPVLVADPARARLELGWAPRYSDLDVIVATAWAWHSGRPAGAR